MIRAVLDSNVFISAVLFGGKPAAILRFVEQGRFILISSRPIRSEVEGVLAKKFAWPRALIKAALVPIWEQTTFVAPPLTLKDCPDEQDNRVLECAVAGEANFIVTGDNDLLELKNVRGIPIVTVAEFLQGLIRT
jgi:putative PIN family toxin of toxin-antitoxin system